MHVPCPKPGCGWTVDPAVVPAGEVVTCPQCGQRFKLAAQAPAPRRQEGFGGNLMAVGGVLLGVVVLAGVVLAAVLLKRNLGGNPAARPSVPEVRDDSRNFRFAPPAAPWAIDPDTRNAVNANAVGLKRPAPEAWAALAVKDFGDRAPLLSELRDAMTSALSRAFDNLPPEPPLEDTTWANLPAKVWRFRGVHRATGAVCAGEAFALSHKGVGYWFYGWAAERDFDPADLLAVRGGFALLDGRGNWKPTAAAEVTFRGPAGGYTLTAYEKVWDTTPASGGPDLELKGVLKGWGNRDRPPRAAVRVWKRPGTVADADAFVRKENTRDPEAFGPTEFVEQVEPPAGDPPPGPEADGAGVKRYRVTTGTAATGQTRRLVAYRAVAVGGEVVVAEASCAWDEREAWDRRFVQLLGSLTAAAGSGGG